MAQRTGSTLLHPQLRLVVLLLGAFALVTLAGCGSHDPPSSSQATTSGDYEGRGYSIDVPAEWSVQESVGPWMPSTRPDPYTAGFDTFIDSNDMVVVGQREVSAGTGPDSWQRSLRREGSLDYAECDRLGEPKPSSLADAPAESRTFSCAAHDVEVELLFAVHGTTGWALMCTIPRGGEVKVEDVCEKRLKSFRFTSQQ